MNTTNKICFLDFDDFSEDNNRLDWLWILKQEFPNFKVNLFAIPNNCSDLFLDYIKSLDWIQLCVHGHKHINNEEINSNWLQTFKIDYTPVYRAPYWQLSDTMYKRLKNLGYKIMLHPDDQREGIKFNWNIKNSPPNLDIIFGHGHIQDVCDNGIVQSFENILKLPKDIEFKFL
jgi:hypothetical protein